jgi:pimeloyl-ACP methyl ester carboxylesterase
MERDEVNLGLPVKVWTGGIGSPLLLLHGGWAGAAAHWSCVWKNLSLRYRVVAPELPGIVSNFEQAMTSYHDYAELCSKLIDALQLQEVIICGNSLGASIAWVLALAHPEKINQLVMVNGNPPRRLAKPMRWLLRNSRLRAVAEHTLKRDFYSSQAMSRAFVDQANVPDEVRHNLENVDPRIVQVMLQLLLNARDSPCQPIMPVHWIWGAQDSLPGVSIDMGKRLSSQFPGGRLQAIDGAGHLPQVEKPSDFIATLNTCVKAT